MEKKCYLEQEDIPPLSEQDHAQKNCFCYLCTCGEHKCPSLSTYHKVSPRYSSSYREKFSRKPLVSSQPFSYMNEILPSKGKMELKSTANEDFKAYEIVSPKKNRNDSRFRSVSPFRLTGSSTYSRNYISYGPLEQSPNIKASQEYYPIKFMGTSTYAQQFVKHGKVAENFEKQVKKGNILSAGGISLLETTNNSTYTKHKVSFLSKPFRHSSMEAHVENSSPHLTTTYGNSFFDKSPRSLIPTLRQFEKQL